MADEFKPNRRQRALIEAAREAADRSLAVGHYAPDELVQRMSLEAQVVQKVDEGRTFNRRWQFRFQFAAELIFREDPPHSEFIATKLAGSGCVGAELFEEQGDPGLSFSLLFDVWAPSGEAALRNAFRGAQEAFPSALVGDFEWPVPGTFETQVDSVWRGGSEPEEPPHTTSAGGDFRVTVCAAVQKSMPTDVMLGLLSPAGCETARCFRRRPAVFIGEFVRFADSQAEAEAAALEALRGLFQDARLLNLDPTPGSTLEALNILAKEGWRTTEEVEAAAARLEELGVDAGEQVPSDDGYDRDGTWAEGRVFEVLEGLQVAHIRLGDGRILALTPQTPGLLEGFDNLRMGQYFECLVDLQLGTLGRVRPLVVRRGAATSIARAKRAIVRMSEKVQKLLMRRK